MSARKQLLKAQPNIVCHYCGVNMEYNHATVDHVVPLCFGGPKVVSNYVWSCRICNNRKGNLSYEQFVALRNNPIKRRAALTQLQACAPSKCPVCSDVFPVRHRGRPCPELNYQ